MIVKKKCCLLFALLLAASMLLSACSSGGNEQNTIRIGYVNPTTGALAGNGEGCQWVVDQFRAYIKDHPIYQEMHGAECHCI